LTGLISCLFQANVEFYVDMRRHIMTSYWKRYLIGAAFVLAACLPGMIRHEPSFLLGAPWFTAAMFASAVGWLPTAWASQGAWGLTTLVVLAIAARWQATTIAVVIFFVLNAWLIYILGPGWFK
jgi:hypothetical protein